MAVAAYKSKFYVTSPPSVSLTNEALTDSGDHQLYTITDQAKRYLDRDAPVTVQVAHDEIQTITITGSPTGGTFTLTFGANTTSGIAYNAPASAVQSALQALASVGSGNALVTGSTGGPYTVRFTGAKGQADQAQLTADASGLTGGTSPNVAVATTQQGSAFTTVTSGFKLYRVNARVVFTSAQALGTAVRFSSGKYYPYAQVGGASSAEFAGKTDTEDVTEFNTDGAKSYIPTLQSGTLKCSTWWTNKARVQALQNRDLLIVSFEDGDGERMEGYCYTTDSSLKADIKSAVSEELTFQLTNEFFVG